MAGWSRLASTEGLHPIASGAVGAFSALRPFGCYKLQVSGLAQHLENPLPVE